MAGTDERATPRIVRFGVWLTLMNSWVLFEEIVVDRKGLWKYMPYYRVAQFCPWDMAAMVFTAWVVWRAFRP